MGVSTEVVHSLRILGLPSDATADDVRSAFRRLARTYHPDVAGKHYSRKFEQITKAYSLLKELPQEEISHAHGEVSNHFSRSRETERPPKSAWEASKGATKSAKNNPGGRISFHGVLGKPFAWYRKRREHAGAEKERLRRAAEDARKKALIEKETRIDAILNRGERLLDDILSRREREMQRVGMQGLILRLTSANCQVRHLALASLANFEDMVNKPEIFEALFDSLQKWEIDDKTARIVSALPLGSENHRRLVRGMAAKAAAMPDALLSHLLQLYNSRAADRELMELYLRHAGASGVALILRRWPQGAFVSAPTLCRLISHEDESVLVTILSAMKQRSIPCPEGGLGRLNAYLSHHNMVVRVWAKALLSSAKKQHF